MPEWPACGLSDAGMAEWFECSLLVFDVLGSAAWDVCSELLLVEELAAP